MLTRVEKIIRFLRNFENKASLVRENQVKWKLFFLINE